jgi:hypothetical protein
MQQAGASAQEEVQIEVEEGQKQYLDLQADLPQAQEEGQRCSRPLPSPGPWSGAVGTEECAPWQPMLLSCVFKSERIVLSADRPHRPQLQGLPHGEDKPFLLQAPSKVPVATGTPGFMDFGVVPLPALFTYSCSHGVGLGRNISGSTLRCPSAIGSCAGSTTTSPSSCATWQREEMTADDKRVTLSDITEKDAAVSSLASCTGLQGRKRGTELVRHRSFDLHRFIVLA